MLKFVDELTRIDVNSDYIILKKIVKCYEPRYNIEKTECVFESEKIFSNNKEWDKYSFDKSVFDCYVPSLNREILYDFVQACIRIIEEKTTDVYKGDITEISFFNKKNKKPKYVIKYCLGCDSMTLNAKDLRKKDEEELLLI